MQFRNLIAIAVFLILGMACTSNTDNIRKQQYRKSLLNVDEGAIEKVFREYLPKISDGRNLNNRIIAIGDLNDDGLLDGIVDYSLEPTLEDNGGGGNAVGEISGLIVIVNDNENLTIVDDTGDYNVRSDLKRIKNGVVLLEGLDYAEGDPRCCPSIKTTTKLVVRNNKLTEVK